MPRKKKDEQNWMDDILNVLGAGVLICFGLVAYSFLLENETLAQFLNPDNWAEFSIIAGILLALYCLLAYLNREVV